MHPLISDLSGLKDSEIEQRINELSRKYFVTHNPDLQNQLVMVLDSYKTELNARRQAEYQKMINSRNKDLDKLIKVN